MDFYKIKMDVLDVEIIRKTLEKKRFLTSLKDADLLSRDLGLLDKNNFYPLYLAKEDSHSSIPKTLGIFSEPDYGLNTDSALTEYVKISKTKPLENYNFVLGLSTDFMVNWPGISFFILKENSKILQFMGGPFNKEKDPYYEIRFPIVDRLASYFHNRRPLYYQIHEMLRLNENEFKKRTSEEFFNDLNLLFSVENSPIEIPDFCIDKNKIFDYSPWERCREDKGQAIGRTTCFIRDNSAGYDSLSKLHILISLNEKDELLFAADIDNYFTTTKADDIYEKGIDVVTNRTNDFLKQFVASTNFGLAIYQKLKNKLLLAAI